VLTGISNSDDCISIEHLPRNVAISFDKDFFRIPRERWRYPRSLVSFKVMPEIVPLHEGEIAIDPRSEDGQYFKDSFPESVPVSYHGMG
jgi:hypothetical protein